MNWFTKYLKSNERIKSTSCQTVLCIVVGVAVVVILISFWSWLSKGESGSATIRNLSLIIAGPIALWLGIWRAKVADRQSKAAQSQVETAQRSLLNERYQKGAEMLSNGILSVRLGGIYALQWLAEEYPEQYHIQIMRLFCAFVRYPTKNDDIEVDDDRDSPRLRDDVQAVMNAIGNRDHKQTKIEEENGFCLDLSNANLRGLVMDSLKEVNLSKAIFASADLSGARLQKINLSDARFYDAKLSCTDFYFTDLRSANFSHATLTCAVFPKAKLQNATFTAADLTKSYFSNAYLDRTRFDSAVVCDADFSHAHNLDPQQTIVMRAHPHSSPKFRGVKTSDDQSPKWEFTSISPDTSPDAPHDGCQCPPQCADFCKNYFHSDKNQDSIDR